MLAPMDVVMCVTMVCYVGYYSVDCGRREEEWEEEDGEGKRGLRA